MFKKSLFILLFTCISSLTFGQIQDWASGFRIGEPGGFMARRYLSNGINAVEINVGAYGGLWGTDRNYKDGTFKNIGFTMNALYLWHHPTLVNSDIHTYYGFGPQYTSRDLYLKGSNTATNNGGFGAAALGGIEFYPVDAPNLSFFGEIGFYNEIAPNPFFFHVQGGIGVRVNF
ncbi:hypothetical protein [Aquirufa rosea]|uniref:Outer membrane protein beta-barrel domain-containing protein n=1 Tax=Aquirufa rosea TaxID=2509241 RepID=A0A4Q1C1X5_9BACT|nr:hypothetical protein [Aquirufa rosea]RXK52200.1 hypothetical protein ESB04_00670 [Aquirufa rosea]